ncbi:hypothetical protein CHARACLAT_030688 [Characodon lateralis]|uniref:Uncharacterized protein n=1 Tax=Characodon lateralis TaxID=208331 RepID=A0ABU7CSN9_9TELE|nr:hypothetical protein [Characodon lateralis]
MSSTPEKPMKTHPHSTSSIHGPAPSTPAAFRINHTVRRNGKARALRNTTPASAHKCNRPSNTKLTMDPLTPPEDGTNSPGKRSLAGGPHHCTTTILVVVQDVLHHPPDRRPEPQ